MAPQEKPIIDRVWEFTKDISVKVSKKAEKHWKINTLRVEIASIKHRKSNSFRELGRFVFESIKANTVEEESYKASIEGFFGEIRDLERDIQEREERIRTLSREAATLEEEIQAESIPMAPPMPDTSNEPIPTEPHAEASEAPQEVESPQVPPSHEGESKRE